MVWRTSKQPSTRTSQERPLATGAGETACAARRTSTGAPEKAPTVSGGFGTAATSAASGLPARIDWRAYCPVESQNQHCGGHLPFRGALAAIEGAEEHFGNGVSARAFDTSAQPEVRFMAGFIPCFCFGYSCLMLESNFLG